MAVKMKTITLAFNHLDGVGVSIDILAVLFAFQLNVKLVESHFGDAFCVEGPSSALCFRGCLILSHPVLRSNRMLIVCVSRN
jgi:hypothetical protein